MPHGLTGCAIAVLLSVALTVGCASPTRYQPVDSGEGYTDRALEDDRYRISFSGNSVTPRETVEDYLLYRSAEVTLARGYDHFIVVEKETERDTTYHTTGTSPVGPMRRGFYSPFLYDPFYTPGFGGYASARSVPVDRYSAYANIVMRHGEKPEGDADAYDARALIDRLGPTIARPDPS